ncbi:CDP-alcohol phosphatidyltransferase family protein [Aquabacter spiritensis]|uniref:CDP-diacylglycerol--glycerol-3-phosphate 3-phosphatidyltransferase n=1 Tax=Aquabacter spiritensis TaxID=933073 RepID=A0A4R3M9X2_9HYPH|nr:CDP-alcohol phosphatidyltransferase family protein [Aquabacter spiritensis]TCT08195.1 cardiolipin synthase [Aquabacter spiritensis]
MSLPNLITLGRILLVPVVVWAIASGEIQLAFWLFLAAGVSDALDGFLAKRFGMQTELGAYLDPLADKALLISIYVSLSVVGLIPRWVAIAVVTRDVMIIGAVLLSVLLARPVHIRPLVVSKVNTLAQIAFAALVLASAGFGIPLHLGFELGLVAVGILTALSAAAYLADWMRHMAD